MSQNKLSIIGDLRTIYSNMEQKKVEFKLPTGDFTYNVKPFLEYSEKKIIVDNSVSGGVDIDLVTQLYKIDRGNVDIIKEYLLVKLYTDIPVLDDILETHNLLKATGLLDSVLKNIDKEELGYINKLIRLELEEFCRLQKMSNDIGYRLEGIVQAINGDMSSMMNKMENYDISDIAGKPFTKNKKQLTTEKSK